MTETMRNFFVLFFTLSIVISAKAQILISDVEQYPIFEACENVSLEQQENCFRQTLNLFVKENLQLPENLAKDDYSGNVTVLFEVTKKGEFKVLYVDAINEDLKQEVTRVFLELPVIKPATYNGKPAYIQFRYPIYVPFSGENDINLQKDDSFAQGGNKNAKKIDDRESTEYADVEKAYKKYEYREFESKINIPFSHEVYSRFDAELNRVGTNSHTATKPFLYQTVNKYYDFKEENKKLELEGDSWSTLR